MRRLFLSLMAFVALSGMAKADLIKQSAAFNRTVLMTSSTDHITGAAALTLTVKVSKNGGAFATITPTVTDLTLGRYSIALATTDTGTLGAIDLQVTASGADPSDTHDQVVAFNPNDSVALGLTAVPASLSGTQTYTHVGNITGNLSGTIGSAQVFNNTGQTLALPTDLQTIKGQTVTAATGVTFPTSIGNSTFAAGQNVGTITGIIGTTFPASVPSISAITAVIPTDYQQRAVAVTLPTTPPTGYGGGAGSTFDAFSQVKGTYGANTWGAYLNAQLLNAVPLPLDVVTYLFATDRYQKSEAANIGNYTRVPSTQVITFTLLNGKTYTMTVSVDSSGKITARSVTTPQ